MDWFESHAGLFSFIAAVAAIVSIILSIIFYVWNSRQSERFYNDWDRKRRYSRDYDAFAEFNDNVRRK